MKGNTDNPGVIAPPPLIFAGCIAAGYILNSFWDVRVGKSIAIGLVLVGIGFIISAWSVIEFIRHGTHPDPRHPTTVIISDGPYRFSRNPIYVAFGLMHLGVGFASGRFWILCAVLPALMLIHHGVVLREERYLHNKFGSDYDRYRSAVRRWF